MGKDPEPNFGGPRPVRGKPVQLRCGSERQEQEPTRVVRDEAGCQREGHVCDRSWRDLKRSIWGPPKSTLGHG